MNVYATNRPTEGYQFQGSFHDWNDPLLVPYLDQYTDWSSDEDDELPDWTRVALVD